MEEAALKYDHPAIRDYRVAYPDHTWAQVLDAYGKVHGPTGLSVDSFSRIHQHWLSHREGARIPGSMPRWAKGPMRNYELAYTHGSLWVDFGPRKEVIFTPGLDAHIGTSAHNPLAMESLIQWVLKYDAFPAFLGDMFNNGRASRRHGSADEVLTLKQAKLKAQEYLEPIQDRTLLIKSGNHEGWSLSQTGGDPSWDVAQMVGVPHCEGPVNATLIVDGYPHKFYFAHGKGGGHTPGALRNFAFKPFLMGLAPTGCVCCQAHVHEPYADSKAVHTQDEGTGDRIWAYNTALVCGSAHKYAGYAEQQEFGPARLGTSWIKLTGEPFVPDQRPDGANFGVAWLSGADA